MLGTGPITSAGARFLIAGLILYAVAAWRGVPRRWSDIPVPLVLVLAIFGFIFDYGLIYVAEAHIDSGIVALLFGSTTLFTCLFSRIMLSETIGRSTVVGLTLAMAGLLVIGISRQVAVSPLFAGAAILAAACSAFSNVYAKQFRADPLISLPPAMTAAGILMLGLGLLLEPLDLRTALSAESLGALVYLAIAGSAVAFFLLLWLIDRLPAVFIGLMAIPIRLIALAFGVILGGEHLDIPILTGTALSTVGLALALVPLEGLEKTLSLIGRPGGAARPWPSENS